MTRRSAMLGVLLAACAVGGPPARAVPSVSVGEAVGMCEAGFPPAGGVSASLARRTACIAYIDGVVGTVEQIAAMANVGAASRGQAVFCVPGNEPYQSLSDVFVRFAKANPQHRGRAAASIFGAAFAAAYPCK